MLAELQLWSDNSKLKTPCEVRGMTKNVVIFKNSFIR